MAHFDRLRIVEHDGERDTARGLKAREQTPDQRLGLLIRHHRHMDPPRILEAIGGEVHGAPRAIVEPDADFAKVELGELARHAFEADLDGRRHRRPHAGEHAIHGAQAERCPLLTQQSADFARRPLGILGHEGRDALAHRRGDLGSADAARLAGCVVRAAVDHRLLHDPANGPDRHSELFRYRARRDLGADQRLNRMSIEHPEHPPCASGERDR